MIVYEKNYLKEIVRGSFKLLLEGYFDLTIGVMVNLSAFILSNIEIETFFASRDDVICSTATIIWSALILFFPIFSWKIINDNQETLDSNDDSFLSVLMEGVNPHNYYASMYSVYFVIRRFFTGILLVWLVEWPFF